MHSFGGSIPLDIVGLLLSPPSRSRLRHGLPALVLGDGLGGDADPVEGAGGDEGADV
jgi:hypothetical protein